MSIFNPLHFQISNLEGKNWTLVEKPLKTACFPIVYKFFHDGISNTLCTESLRHGTNLWNNLLIRLSGADPSQGGKVTGSTHMSSKDLRSNLENSFYLFKDSEFFKGNQVGVIYKGVKCSPLARSFKKHYYPKIHVFLSSYNQIAHLIPNSKALAYSNYPDFRSSFRFGFLREKIASETVSALCKIYAMAATILSPTICFHFSKIDPALFQNDPYYFSAAYKTQQAIPPWRIGITGAFLAGFNWDWFSRALARPQKVGIGIGQLALSGSLLNWIFSKSLSG